jgi:AcrR family transcriptional regulator
MTRPKRIADDDVLRLAREVILARGAGVSTVEIAAHVGLSQPTLFQRFGDKATLMRRALAPDPVAPEAILGPADEPERLGLQGHLAALSGRLFDAMLMVVERTQMAAAGGLFAQGAQEAAHAQAGNADLVQAIEAHLTGLAALRLSGGIATETLLFLVHGAAVMAYAAPRTQHNDLRDRLQASAIAAMS